MRLSARLLISLVSLLASPLQATITEFKTQYSAQAAMSHLQTFGYDSDYDPPDRNPKVSDGPTAALRTRVNKSRWPNSTGDHRANLFATANSTSTTFSASGTLHSISSNFSGRGYGKGTANSTISFRTDKQLRCHVMVSFDIDRGPAGLMTPLSRFQVTRYPEQPSEPSVDLLSIHLGQSSYGTETHGEERVLTLDPGWYLITATTISPIAFGYGGEDASASVRYSVAASEEALDEVPRCATLHAETNDRLATRLHGSIEANGWATEAEFEVWREGRESERIRVPAYIHPGTKTQLATADVNLWALDQPHLYQLRVKTLAGTITGGVRETRFDPRFLKVALEENHVVASVWGVKGYRLKLQSSDLKSGWEDFPGGDFDGQNAIRTFSIPQKTREFFRVQYTENGEENSDALPTATNDGEIPGN